MNCTANTALPIAQCAGTVNVGELVSGSGWILRVVNMASRRTEYVEGDGTSIVLEDFAFSPGSTYELRLSNVAPFEPFAGEGQAGTTEVTSIYVKVDKVFSEDGTIYTPADQWIILSQ